MDSWDKIPATHLIKVALQCLKRNMVEGGMAAGNVVDMQMCCPGSCSWRICLQHSAPWGFFGAGERCPVWTHSFPRRPMSNDPGGKGLAIFDPTLDALKSHMCSRATAGWSQCFGTSNLLAFCHRSALLPPCSSPLAHADPWGQTVSTSTHAELSLWR